MFLESNYKDDDSRPTVLVLKNGRAKIHSLEQNINLLT